MTIDVKALRQKLELTQEQFAVRIGVCSLTVRRWEKGVTVPSRMAQKLLKEIEAQGKAIK